MNEFQIGDYVSSLCGRDAGCLYVICDIKDGYAFLLDGKGKTIDNPKKKKLKHIKSMNKNCSVLAEKFMSGKVVYDSELRKWIRNFETL